MSPTSAPEVEEGQTLFSNFSAYTILEFVGEGCFGKVAKCEHFSTREKVAVKILKKCASFIKDTEEEVSILNIINCFNPDNINVVKFIEHFDDMGYTCLAFEMLDCSLYQLLVGRVWKPLSLIEMRPITQQLLVALDALKNLDILHTDIKPDNIMLVNRQQRPLRVKLIDFSVAITASKIQPGMELQPAGYRAPEIALGLPFTEAIDVWGVACCLAFLYLAENLFPVDCNYQMMKCMVEVLGQPEDQMLLAGKYTKNFFNEEEEAKEAAGGPTWRLMTPEEYQAVNNIEPKERNSFLELPSSLDGLVNMYPEMGAAESEDRGAFVDMMKGLLLLDGDQRISPCQALLHPFITTSHLMGHVHCRDYLTSSQFARTVNAAEDTADRPNISLPPTAEFQEGGPTGSTGDAAKTLSFDGAKASGSPGRTIKFLRRMRRFFAAAFHCCVPTTVED